MLSLNLLDEKKNKIKMSRQLNKLNIIINSKCGGGVPKLPIYSAVSK